MNKNWCISCIHYWGDEVDGECRRFPPREMRAGHMAVFPRVIPDSWCGEHSRLQPEDTTVS